MAGLNKVILIGHIGRDPEVYVFDNGNKKISFSLATTESYRDRDKNEWIEQTEWHNIAGYRYLADKNFAKGDLVVSFHRKGLFVLTTKGHEGFSRSIDEGRQYSF